MIFDHLPASIADEVTVFGGALRDLILGTPVNDLDLATSSPESERIALEFFAAAGKAGPLTERHGNFVFNGTKVQVLRGIHLPASARDVALISDFTICCCAATREETGFHPHFLRDLERRHLRLHKIPYPLATLARLQKFNQRGFIADDPTLLRLAEAIAAFNFGDRSMVSAQLPEIAACEF
jgi:hypothetical protein